MQGRGITAAKRKKRATVRKTKSQKVKAAKKPVKRATSGKSRRTTKRVAAEPSRKWVSARKPRPAKQMVPVVEGEIIDVVDEPMPGVVRVTEIETMRVTVPGSDEENEL